jgi:hypothetical protein
MTGTTLSFELEDLARFRECYGHNVFSETLNTAGETPALPKTNRLMQGSATVPGRWPRRDAEAPVGVAALEFKPL